MTEDQKKIVEAFLAMLPEHKGELTLTHNEPRSYYETVAQHIETREGPGTASASWPSREERQKAIDTDEIWELQWYPRGATSFYLMAAATLPALIEFVMKEPRE